MANTLPDISVPDTAWTNLYSASGITVGTALIIQNKGARPVTIQIAASLPLATDTKGFVLTPFSVYQITAGEAGAFAIAMNAPSIVNVQRGA